MADYVDIRASFLRFPAWTQHFWTWSTGRALPGQRPLIKHTWLSYLATTLAIFLSGLTLSTTAVILKFNGWHLVLVGGWAFSLAGARIMILVIAHQCIHKQFSGRRAVDILVSELVTVLAVYEDAQTFRQEHFEGHHRSAIFATHEDPPVQFLCSLGFHPGMSKKRLWRRAAIVFVSPSFYWRGMKSRLWCNVSRGGARRALFIAWAGWWLSLPLWAPNGIEALLLAFFFPVVLMAQLSALLDKLGEHAWLTRSVCEPDSKRSLAAVTWARFCGRAVPHASLPFRQRMTAWSTWLVSMCLYHLPSRLFVIVGDLPNHDFHHRHPGSPEWAVAAYARQREIDENPNDSAAYTETWGMTRAIDLMFEGMSGAPAAGIPVGAGQP